jgi:hypothetical protein
MKRRILILFTNLLWFSCSYFSSGYEFKTDNFKFSVNDKGNITALCNLKSGKDYQIKDSNSPIMAIRMDDKYLNPQSVKLSDDKKTLLLKFSEGIEAKVKVDTKNTHLTFELTEISDEDSIDLIVWGPYETIINKIIGETVGVVRGEDFAIGIQALNPKTLGGYPWQENDCMPQIDIFDQDDPTDLSEEGKRYVLYRVEAAKPTENGSSLQAYCRNRNTDRVIENWGHEKYVAPAFDDGGIIGSKIALFGCPVERTMETLSNIEIAEGLPHPMIDGQWGKVSPTASAAYLIMGFGEKDIEKALDICGKAGLRYLYHPGPFENWGHFELNKDQFPMGVQSLKNCVQKAEQSGIMVGVHTLSNFITTNDPYVTPVPDPRLAKVGSSVLTSDIDKRQTEIPVASPDFFNQYKNNSLKSVVVGDEIIRYASVSEQEPWKLLDCQRGAFDTKAASHKKDTEIAMLADHAYKVFLTNPELNIEMSKNIADLFNAAGLRQISFDGLEGCRSTGMGNYGEILFTTTWFNHLNDAIRSHYIADASRTSHYFWHIYTRMNWGEPWYAGFRESQTEYRMKNQAYFSRNLMPGMLGWFRMTPETSLEDIEWMLARSAAFNAGYGFVLNYDSYEKNVQSAEILDLLGTWENARLSGSFSDEQRERMKDLNNEFHLKSVSDQEWQLQQIYSYKFKHEKKVRQPGEPLYSTFNFENPVDEQAMGFILTANGAEIDQIKMELDNYKQIAIPVKLGDGETIKYSGGENAQIFNKNWKLLREIKMDAAALKVSKGEHNLNLNCRFGDGKEPAAKLEIRIPGPEEAVK